MSDEKVMKSFLPSKKCPVCESLFSWRKKWACCWHRVVYCSSECMESAQANSDVQGKRSVDEQSA